MTECLDSGISPGIWTALMMLLHLTYSMKSSVSFSPAVNSGIHSKLKSKPLKKLCWKEFSIDLKTVTVYEIKSSK